MTKENAFRLENIKRKERAARKRPCTSMYRGDLQMGIRQLEGNCAHHLTHGRHSAALAGGSGLRLARSWLRHSHASLHPQFASPGLCYAKSLFGLANRRLP